MVKIRFVILQSESYLRLIFLILINRYGWRVDSNDPVYIFFLTRYLRVKVAPITRVVSTDRTINEKTIMKFILEIRSIIIMICPVHTLNIIS